MNTIGNLAACHGFFVFARFSVVAFFAVVFLQSSLDKLLDSDGNLAYLRDHFKDSLVPEETLVPMFWILTCLELAAGLLCGLAIVTFSFWSGGFIARWGMRFVALALI